ncbi:MAG: flagellar export chaperone FliS [Candidatus Dadabacteria bacterium]|nr:MAG: flagellar export chaperone FliS [Candidatus Dadabacteria bacterium]
MLEVEQEVNNEERVVMYAKNAHNKYKSVEITTTDRGRLLLLMYDGAIKFLKQSKAGLEANDLPKFCRFLSKAQAVIAELMNTLDFEKGGKIARDLDRLYDFMLFYLTEANLHRDGKRITRVIELLNKIYSAYKEIILNRKADTQPQKKGASSKAQGEGLQISL